MGGVLAIAQTAGVIVGSGIAAVTGSIAAGYLTIAVVLIVTTVPYALNSRDIPLPAELRPPFRWGPFLRGFWVSPRQHPDFGWAWITRFLMNLGNAILILYLLFYLKDEVHLSADAAEDAVFTLTAVYGLVTVVTALVGGWWSDRVGRRKRVRHLVGADRRVGADDSSRSSTRCRPPTSVRSCSASASAPTRPSTSP